jgi:hypothetical protein
MKERHHIIPQWTVPRLRAGQPAAAKLVATWQQRGPETLSGIAVRKLRLAFAPADFVLTASAAG